MDMFFLDFGDCRERELMDMFFLEIVVRLL
jgi:hypothetical protein